MLAQSSKRCTVVRGRKKSGVVKPGSRGKVSENRDERDEREEREENFERSKVSEGRGTTDEKKCRTVQNNYQTRTTDPPGGAPNGLCVRQTVGRGKDSPGKVVDLGNR